MIKQFSKRSIVVVLIAAQVALAANFIMFPPKTAEAVWGIGDFTFNTEVANWYDIFKDIGRGAAERIAINYANKYLTRFVDKLLDKYRIKDYLNYEKVLSGYYLNKYVYEHVDDPDLRAIYGIIARDISSRATVTDPVTGQKKPVLAALKEKLDKYYYGQGGINPNSIYYPNRGTYATDVAYFQAAQAYFASPPDFTQNQVYGEYGRLLATSQGASATEIANSNGLKNDRSNPTGSPIPHVCEGFGSTPKDYVDEPHDDGFDPNLDVDPRANEQACVAHGGEWKVDKLGTAQTIIQNPSAFIHDFATNSIKQVFEANFGVRDNIYTTIGSLLGNFIFNKLNLNKNSGTTASGFDGTLNDGGTSYEGDAGNVPIPKGVDLDGDNIPDGQDNDLDGLLNTLGETCFHGGTPGNCIVSQNAVTSPYFTPICRSIDEGVVALTEFTRFIDTYADQMEGGASLKGQIIGGILLGGVGVIFGGFFGSGSIDNFKNKADAIIWARRAGEVNSAMDNIVNNIQSYRSSYFDTLEFSVGRYSVFIGDVLQSLQKDSDLDLARMGSGGGGLQNLMKKSGYILRYLIEVKAQIGKCENPNLRAVSEIPGTPQEIFPDDPLPGEGACVRFISFGSAKFQGAVADAVTRAVLEAERSGLADLPATRGGNIEAFRDLVINEIDQGGNEGSTAHNGNCNISPNQVAIRSGAEATGEAYDIVREQDDKTIKESARVNYVGDASWTFFTSLTP